MRFETKGYIPIFIALFYLISPVSAQANNPGDQASNIIVALDHIFISNANNSLEISEIVVFRNEGQEIYYSNGNNSLFAISTPPNITNLKIRALECCFVQDKGVVYMDPVQSIKPGENFEMKISYILIPQGQEILFNKSAVYNTTSISIFVDKKRGLVIGGSDETITISGIGYNFIIFNDLKRGETISVPVQITKESGNLYVKIGLFLLISIVLVYFFKQKLNKKRTKELTLEELELEKRKIFHTIYGFEKHAGKDKSDEFTKLMEEYKNKAMQIYFKIDNFNNKI